ncbi:MAG: hypothetical protein WC666_01680 [Candidatus Paceibacterota bacterium]
MQKYFANLKYNRVTVEKVWIRGEASRRGLDPVGDSAESGFASKIMLF